MVLIEEISINTFLFYNFFKSSLKSCSFSASILKKFSSMFSTSGTAFFKIFCPFKVKKTEFARVSLECCFLSIKPFFSSKFIIYEIVITSIPDIFESIISLTWCCYHRQDRKTLCPNGYTC